jgi:hypothetical protein
VNEQIESGRKLIERLTANGIPITAAAWVKESDLWEWYLYLVTPLVSEDGDTLPAYHRMNAVLRNGPQPPEIHWFHIKAVSPAEAVGRAILGAQRQGRRPWGGYPGDSLGGVSVDAAYFYPPLVAAGP